MTAAERLRNYVSAVQSRLRWWTALTGLALTAAVALATTMSFVAVANQYRFANRVVWVLRISLFALTAGGLITLLIGRTLRWNRQRTVRQIETQAPEFQERVLTLADPTGDRNPFEELIAEEALAIAEERPAHKVVSTAALAYAAAGAICFIGVLLWLVIGGPGIWGYGASLLWIGQHKGAAPIYAILVEPGNRTVRRNAGQVIEARLHGFSADHVMLRARYAASSKWETLAMQPNQNGRFLFEFPSLTDDLDYLVEAGPSRSEQFRLRVKDLPRVLGVKVSLHYPSEVRLQDVSDESGGDVRAVEGTVARISIHTDRPLQNGSLALEDGSKIALTQGLDHWWTGTLTVKKDGSYHVEDQEDELVRISDDYFVEAKKNEPPTVRITRPGRDPHVSPIEEVPITLEAADDFGVHSLELHYSVNGGVERTLSFPASARQATGKTLLAFENFHLQPGDLVSMYATASDGSTTARSDILFAQAEPFDYQFRQSQQGGGGQGGDQDSSQISDRQKEIIAATWNELKDGPRDAATVSEHGKFLSELQDKLAQQSQALAERMGKRELSSANAKFEEFSRLMSEASARMGEATKQLQPASWNAALVPEQKALQSLLRAESLFRDIQVAFNQSGGSGGRNGGAERDLARMFDLELDTSKNQYESGQQAEVPGGEQQQKLNDALQRLKDLAKRQQEMAQNPHSQQAFEQRWEQEQLRREAEQLRRELQQQSAKSQNGSQSQNSSQQTGSSPASSSSSAASGAMQSLAKAEEQMRKASGQNDSGASQQAERDLQEAQRNLERSMQSRANDSLNELARQARDLATRQQELAENVKRQYGAQGINTTRRGLDEKPQMPEMTGPGYGSWYRRRLGVDEPQPSTAAEKQLASQADQLSKQTADMQSKMQRQLQQLTATDMKAARALRKALSDAEQQELALRMQKGAEWLRSGHGAETWPLQDSVTAGMQQLARGVEEAQRTLDSGAAKSGDGPGADSPTDREQRALDNLQRLQGEMAAGGLPTLAGTAELRGDLTQLGREDSTLQPYTSDALGALRQGYGQSGLLDARLNQDTLRHLERLRMELARRLGAAQPEGARVGSQEDLPREYRDAVAEYFRKLSQ